MSYNQNGLSKEELNIIMKIFKRKCITQIGNDGKNNSSKTILITTKELKEINLIIKHPTIQTTLDDDKITEMSKAYDESNQNSHFFLSCALITIARIVVGNQEDYYLVDGQHRINMALDLLEKNDDNNKTFFLSIITITTKKEIESLMILINKDSKKYIYKDYPIFDQILFEGLKVEYLEKYSFLPKRSAKTTRVCTIDEFVHLLIQNNIKKLCDTDEPHVLFTFIRKKEKEFFNIIGYLEKLHEKKNKFKSSEVVCIENKSCMFMKNNNFIKWLINPSVKPTHDYN